MCFFSHKTIEFFVLHSSVKSFLNSLCEYLSLVLLDVCDVLFANRDVVLQVEVIIYCTEWQCLLFFEESQALEELALVLVLAEGIKWFKECLQQ